MMTWLPEEPTGDIHRLAIRREHNIAGPVTAIDPRDRKRRLEACRTLSCRRCHENRGYLPHTTRTARFLVVNPGPTLLCPA
jgi:hypothetical protein